MTRLQTTLAVIAVGLIGLLALPPAPAQADIATTVRFASTSLEYTYTPGAGAGIGQLTIYDVFNKGAASSYMEVYSQNASNVTLEKATIQNNGGEAFQLLATMDIYKIAAGSYKALGTIGFTDTDMTSNAFEADFTSNAGVNGIYATSSGGMTLHIDGTIVPLGTNTSILVNRDTATPTGTWTYAGTAGIPGTTVTAGPVPPLNQFVVGEVWYLDFSVKTLNLDKLFSATDADRLTSSTAQASGYTTVPAPAAIVLGLMGLGTLGWWMRRYA
jgi:hypothetical protein